MSDWLPPLDYVRSSYTGWTRAHWEAVLARLTYGFTLAFEPQGSPARALFPNDRCDRPDPVEGCAVRASAETRITFAVWVYRTFPALSR